MIYSAYNRPSKIYLMRYGLSVKDRAAIICDAWTGSFSKAEGLEIRRPVCSWGTKWCPNIDSKRDWKGNRIKLKASSLDFFFEGQEVEGRLRMVGYYCRVYCIISNRSKTTIFEIQKWIPKRKTIVEIIHPSVVFEYSEVLISWVRWSLDGIISVYRLGWYSGEKNPWNL